MKNLDKQIEDAVRFFWKTRTKQHKKQNSVGKKDQGGRGAATGGKQMEGFEKLAIDVALQSGIDENSIFQSKSLELPGFYRPTKKWDLLIIEDDALIAAVEFKSQVGPSFGNNFNNRLEEALGSATDLWTAFREKAFGVSARPWLGYFFVLEDCEEANSPVKVFEPHFKVFPEFKEASYAKRYNILLEKLLLERLYDGASLLLTSKKPFSISEPEKQLSTKMFYAKFKAHLRAHIEGK